MAVRAPILNSALAGVPSTFSNLRIGGRGSVVLLPINSSMQRMVVRGWWMAWVFFGGGDCPKQRGRAPQRIHGHQQHHVDRPGRAVFRWIEIYNSGLTRVNLDGWYLTDDSASPTKWRFPATDLFPRSYLMVFASGKNRSVSGAELHTNFKLDGHRRVSGAGDAGRRDRGFSICAAISPATGRCFLWTRSANRRGALFRQSDLPAGKMM